MPTASVDYHSVFEMDHHSAFIRRFATDGEQQQCQELGKEQPRHFAAATQQLNASDGSELAAAWDLYKCHNTEPSVFVQQEIQHVNEDDVSMIMDALIPNYKRVRPTAQSLSYSRATPIVSTLVRAETEPTPSRKRKREAIRWGIDDTKTLLRVVSDNLSNNNRSKRSWKTCSDKWNDICKQKGIGHVINNDDLKMKVKQLLRERPNRSITNFWNVVKKATSPGIIASKLVSFLPADWPILEIANYLFEKKPKTYLSVHLWKDSIKSKVIAKIQELHKVHGTRTIQIHKRVEGLITIFDLEIAVCGYCSCEFCKSTGIDGPGSSVAEQSLQHTKSKCT
eukprot:CAMPEP_0203765476 /NCGR_PEP_ID=MMETSP0098-20131031/18434_1 /ASSEMBLY_ACC=CAM_ASM_000208 /TAXON_ID=96639 /ORGANISM=" , Strain NY0313808BC1" /LENGTH=337 /DNA_ID=CAMNT_0050661733 /DNA_START=3 /DNA_END=1012 /DNA_ORIENTATION=+